MMAHKNLLTAVNPQGYSVAVAETTVTGFSSPQHSRRTTAARRYFFVRTPSRAFKINGRALVGRANALPVSLSAGLLTLPCARSPHLAVGSGFTATQGGRTLLRHIPARPEQKSFPNTLTIVNDALRAAALSDRPNDAIDLLADALVKLAALAQVEVRHA